MVLVVRTYSRRDALRFVGGISGLVSLGWYSLGCGPDIQESIPERAIPLQLRQENPNDRRTGRLRLGVRRESVNSAVPLSRFEEMLVYSRLIAVDPRDATIYSDLASNFEIVDSLKVVFRIRPNAFFHHDALGMAVPITSELIQRDFERRAEDGTYLFSEVIENVTAPESNTLVVELRAPFASFFEFLSAPEAGIRGESGYRTFLEPVGSGPFVPAGQDLSGYVLFANPNYYEEGYPRLEEISVLHLPTESDLDAAFFAGQLDVREHHSVDSLGDTRERSSAREVSRYSRSQRGLGLSLLPKKGGEATRYIEAFQDERVRRAISISLDRSALATLDSSAVAGPVGAAHTADALPVAELIQHPLYRHDPLEAKRLLSAAGAEGIEFEIITSKTFEPHRYIDLLESQLRDVGFRARFRLEEHSDWQRSFLAGDFEATLLELHGLDTPDMGLRLHTTGGLNGDFSLWGYSNPIFDSAVVTALSELVPDRRADAMRKAQRTLLDEVPGMFPLTTPIEIASIGQHVSGYEFDAFDFNTGWLASEWEHNT